VKRYLIKKGTVNGEMISTIGYGKTRPIASNDTEEGRAQNRRVEIIILAE
jgi:outer membrane protein OmpA-like peptidoglycan-associated protein